MEANPKTVDLTHLEAKHQGKWVVMSEKTRKVYAYSDDPAIALKKAEKAGCKNPILHKVMPFDKAFISCIA